MPAQNIPEENVNNIEELLTYIPTEWKSGDVVTSEKLNKIETGITRAQTIIVPTSQREIQVNEQLTSLMSIQYPAGQLAEAFLGGVNIIIQIEGSYLRLTGIGQIGENMIFACPDLQPASSNPFLYWFAPSSTDILVLYNPDMMQYLEQIYGTTPASGGDEGAAT